MFCDAKREDNSNSSYEC